MKTNHKIIIGGILLIGAGYLLYSKNTKDATIVKISEKLGENSYNIAKQLKYDEQSYVNNLTSILLREILLKYRLNTHESYLTAYIKKAIMNDPNITPEQLNKIIASEKEYNSNISNIIYPIVKSMIEKDNVKFN